METIKAIAGGRDRILALWEGPKDTEVYKITKAAGREVENTSLRIGRIMDDDRRSDVAKRDDRKTAGLDSLNALGKMAQHLQSLRDRHQQRVNALAAVTPYRDGDTATPQIDIEVARNLKVMTNPLDRMTMLVSGEHPRIVEAVLRLPPMLSGLSEGEHRRIYTAAINRQNPEEFHAIQQESTDLETTGKALKKAFKLIVDQTGADTVVQVEAAGGQAKELVSAPRHVVDAIQSKGKLPDLSKAS